MLFVSTLFNVYVIRMVEELERAQLGVKLEGHWCGALIYVDDIVLVVDSGMELPTILCAADYVGGGSVYRRGGG